MPSPPRNLPGAARIVPQLARLDHHRAFQLDAFDRAVAHVALAHRHRAGLAVLERPPAPAAALDALHHEAPLGLRDGCRRTPPRRRAAHDAPAGTRSGIAWRSALTMASTTVGTMPLQPAIGAGKRAIMMLPSGMMTSSARNEPSLTGSSGAGQRLVGDARAGVGARVDRGLALGRAAATGRWSCAPDFTVTLTWIGTSSPLSTPSSSIDADAS